MESSAGKSDYKIQDRSCLPWRQVTQSSQRHLFEVWAWARTEIKVCVGRYGLGWRKDLESDSEEELEAFEFSFISRQRSDIAYYYMQNCLSVGRVCIWFWLNSNEFCIGSNDSFRGSFKGYKILGNKISFLLFHKIYKSAFHCKHNLS